MNKIFIALRRLLVSRSGGEPDRDALASMSSRELADLPVYHPRTES